MNKIDYLKIKEILKQCEGCSLYFNSKKKELRVTVYKWQDEKKREKEIEKRRIINILTKLSENGFRPKYRRETKKYQGFLNCSYIIFE